jgi:prolipoprotein diacylglyceryltransferase
VIAFYLPGGVPVHIFALLLGLSGSFGLAWVAWEAPPESLNQNLNAGLILLLGGILGGRALYLALQWPYYQAHMGEMPQIYAGGLSWIGAAGGGLVTLALYARLQRVHLGALLDGLFPLAALIVVGAWMACWLNGYAYGPQSSAWWAVPARDEWGMMAPRLPVQPLGALVSLGVLWLVDRLRKRYSSPQEVDTDQPAIQPGLIAIFGYFCLSLEVFVLSFLRADPTPIWAGLRLDTWSALGFTLLTGLAWIYLSLEGNSPSVS